MQTDIVIIGGGLSGLTATWQLRRAGLDARLIETRTRFGGRVLTVDKQADCDLGPSWFWAGQPLIASLLKQFNIPYYEQYVTGDILFQQMDGRILRTAEPSPMTGSRRIQGGVNHLVNAIVAEIDESARFLGHMATGLSSHNDLIAVDVTGPSGKIQIEAKKVAIAIPPRLAADLIFTPELPPETVNRLMATPTWMAAHAKFFAVYNKPFWRENGLCGTVISRYGPLAEIHDASPNSEAVFSLFGFSGLDSKGRATLGRAEFIKQALNQFVALFGAEAGQPKAIHFQDWSTEKFTAHEADHERYTHHPQYGLNLPMGDVWSGKVEFISTETSFSNGGLIEGALEAGLKFAKGMTDLNLPLEEMMRQTHTASMSWDWL